MSTPVKGKNDGRWCRLYDDVVDNIKVQALPSHAFKAWVNLLCIASRERSNGALPSLQGLAFRLRLTMQQTEDVLSELVSAKLVVVGMVGGRQIYRLHDWELHQPRSERSRDRMRKLRAKRRREAGDGSVTGCDASRDGLGDGCVSHLISTTVPKVHVVAAAPQQRIGLQGMDVDQSNSITDACPGTKAADTISRLTGRHSARRSARTESSR